MTTPRTPPSTLTPEQLEYLRSIGVTPREGPRPTPEPQGQPESGLSPDLQEYLRGIGVETTPGSTTPASPAPISDLPPSVIGAPGPGPESGPGPGIAPVSPDEVMPGLAAPGEREAFERGVRPAGGPTAPGGLAQLLGRTAGIAADVAFSPLQALTQAITRIPPEQLPAGLDALPRALRLRSEIGPAGEGERAITEGLRGATETPIGRVLAPGSPLAPTLTLAEIIQGLRERPDAPPPRPGAGRFEQLVEAERAESPLSQIIGGAVTDPLLLAPAPLGLARLGARAPAVGRAAAPVAREVAPRRIGVPITAREQAVDPATLRQIPEQAITPAAAPSQAMGETIGELEQRLADVQRQLQSGVPDELRQAPGGQGPFAQFELPARETDAALERLAIQEEQLGRRIQQMVDEQAALAVPEQQAGALQSSMGFGEAPPQGALFPESPTAATRQPLADPDQLQAQAARREAIEQGQQEFPEEDALEAARLRLDEAQAVWEGVSARGLPAPRFGSPESAAFLAERRRLASEGQRVVPKVEQRRLARAELQEAQAELARVELEHAISTGEEAPNSIWRIFGPTQIAEASSKNVPVQTLVQPPPEGIRLAQEIATERIRQAQPGVLTKVADAIPGPRQIGRFFVPARGLPRQQHEAWVTRATAKAAYATNITGERYTALNSIEQAFGRAFRHGEKAVGLEYIGPAERAGSDLIGTPLDVLPNPDYYALSDAQLEAISDFARYQDFSLEHAVQDYGASIGKFEVKPGGAFVPNVDVSEQALDILGDVSTAARVGRAKTRVFQDAVTRQAEDPTFVPLRDLDKLTRGSDEAKANMVAGKAFKDTLGGKTLIDVLEETHPGLRQAKLDMANKLQGLNQQLRTLERQSGATAQAIRRSQTQLTQTQRRANPILNAIDDLGAEYGPEFSYLSGQARELLLRQAALERQGVKFIVRGARQDIRRASLLTELNELAPQLETLRKRYAAANLRGYQLVREGGVYRYFKADEAKTLRNLLETSDSKFLGSIYEIRNIAFNLDLSPIFGVHLQMGFLADPLGTARQMGRGLNDIRRGKTLADSIGPNAVAKSVAEDPVSWSEFAAVSGRPVSATPEEFAGGLVNRIPGWSKVNQSMFGMVTQRSKAMFDDLVQGLEKQGVPHNEAVVAASETVNRAIPLIDPSILGQSQARAKLLNSVSISSSFLLKPPEMMAEFAVALLKAGTKQTLTHKQRLALKVGLSMIATAETISVVSAMLDAKAHNRDMEKAAIKALANPGIYLMDGRVIPIGGPYRSLLTAMKPRWVNKEMDFMVPFAGLMPLGTPGEIPPRWLMGKLTPALRRQYDLVRNKDFRGRRIITEDFPVNILQAAEYELEGFLPLSIGSSLEAYRHGEPGAKIGEEAVSQFMGTSVYDRPGPWAKRSEWREDLRRYWAIPTSRAARAKEDVPSRLNFRKSNPRIDAQLFILGEVTSLQTNASLNEAYRIIQEERFAPDDIKGIAKRRTDTAELTEAGLTFNRNRVDVLIEALEALEGGR